MRAAQFRHANKSQTRTEVFEIPYEMPNITGDYYLVAYADYKDVIKESNENNNMYFISDKNGKPLKFTNGVMQQHPQFCKKGQRPPLCIRLCENCM